MKRWVWKGVAAVFATLLIFTLGCENARSKVGLQATTQASPSSPESSAKQEQQFADEERKAQAEEKARKLREELGDEIETHLNYWNGGAEILPQYRRKVWQAIGYQFSNVKMFVNRKTGTLTIAFNCQFFNKNAEGYQSAGGKIPLLVRLFDENGQYITHFHTEERYVTPVEFRSINRKVASVANFKELKQENNYLQYPINLRDAAYIQKAEFGFDIM